MSSLSFTVATVSISFFAATFLYGVVVPVLPFMLEKRLGISHDDLQYYCSLSLTNYSAASFTFSPVAGAIADRATPRKAPFLLATLLLIAVSPQDRWLRRPKVMTCLTLKSGCVWIFHHKVDRHTSSSQNRARLLYSSPLDGRVHDML
jgi:MFS family permease